MARMTKQRMANRRSERADLEMERALDEHRQALAGCHRCDQQGTARPIVSLARRPRIMLVGQAPGQMEVVSSRPFSGRAGRTLFRWLEDAGISEAEARERILISAITRCYPGPAPSGRGDRVPSRTEQAHCADWLAMELRIVKPALLIPVGRLAIERFFGARALDTVVGREHRIEHEGGETLAIPLPHPSGASSWIHQSNHKMLLGRSLALLRARLEELKPAEVGSGRREQLEPADGHPNASGNRSVA